MKRAIIASILGIAASVASVSSTSGQGYIVFSNYGYTTYARVTFTPSGPGVDSDYYAVLYYFLGTANPITPSYLDPVTAYGFTQNAGQTQINTGQFASPAGAGFFTGGAVIIPDYVSGPITFIVGAYNSVYPPSGDYASAFYRAHSASFTLNSIATGALPVPEFGPGFQPFSIIPEPSAAALGVLGLVSLLILRRRRRP